MRRLIWNLVLVVTSLTVAVVAFEIILRAFGFSYPSFYTYDDYTGVRHRPGAEGWYTREGKAYVRINSKGMRDREHTTAKPAGAFRVAVLGDSVAEAFQLPMEDTFWAVVERELNNSNCNVLNGKVAEVLNFGVSGYGTAQELLTLERHVWVYSPDLILLAFFTGNDVRNNSRSLEWERLRPFYFLDHGRLQLDNSFMESTAYRIRRSFLWRIFEVASTHLKTVQMLVKARHEFAVWRSAAQMREARAAGKAELGLDAAIYVEPNDEAWTTAWDITEKLVERMRDEVEARGARFLLVSLSNPDQVNPHYSEAKKLAQDLGVKDLFYPDRRLESFGRRKHIKTIVLAPDFRDYAATNNVCLHGFDSTNPCMGHWNEKGHQLAGRIIARHICSGTQR